MRKTLAVLMLCLLTAACGSRRTPEEAASIRAARAAATGQALGSPTAGDAATTGDAGDTSTEATPADPGAAADTGTGSAAGSPSGGDSAGSGQAAAPGASAPAGGGTVTTRSGPAAPRSPAGASAAAPKPAAGAKQGANPAATGPVATGPAKYDSGINDQEIRIGLTGPLSGIFGFYGEEMVAGLDSYAKLVNESGGIGGRKIRVISYDDRLDPTAVLTNVKRFVERDQVFAIFALWSDSVMEYVTQKGVPLLTMGVTAPPYASKYSTVVPLQANVLTWNQQLAEAVTQHMNIKPKRVGIIYDTTLFDERPYLPYFRETWQEFGAEVVALEPMNLSDGDCTSVALKMRSAQVEFWNFETLAWPLCITAMDRIGWRPPLGMGGWPASAAGVGNIVGPSVAGIIAMNIADQPTGAPRKKAAAHDEYAKTVAKYYPKMNNQGALESSATLGYYTGMKLFTEGLKAIGPNYTRPALLSWLNGVKNFDLGIQPPIKGLAANCKQGTGETWWAPWQWDKQKNNAFRTPATPYIKPDRWAAKYGGPCFVTRIADEIVGR